MKFVQFLAFALILLLAPITVAFSQETSIPNETAVAAELRSLATSVDRLARVLEANSGSTEQEMLFEKLNLAIAYLNFRSRRIESLEQDMQSARNARDQIESTLNVWLKQQDEISSTESVLPNEELKQRTEEFKMRIDMVKGRLARLDNEIITLENKIFELQGQIDSVEEFVQKNLNL